MPHPHTAIVVLSHNNVEITKKFLELLFKRTKDFYLIMIDNGSTDSTVSYLESKVYANEENPSMILVYNQQNLGVIGGRNQGYALYSTLESVPEYLCFLDNDQFVRDGWLEQHHEFMQKGKYDVVGADAWLMNTLYKPVHNCKNPGEPFSYVGCGGMMVKKAVLDKIGLFDEQFNPAYFEDPDFNFRVRQSGFNVGWNFAAKIDHLPHQTLGKSKDRMVYFKQSYERFVKKWQWITMNPIRQNPII